MFETSGLWNTWRFAIGGCLALAMVCGWGCSAAGKFPSWKGLTPVAEAEANAIPWQTSYEQAQAEAGANNKAVMLWFTGSDWCKYCTMLEQEVFETETFRDWYGDKVVPVMLDFPRQSSLPPNLQQQNEMLKDRYAKMVTSYPTALFVTADGEVIGKMGYMKGGPDAWVHRAEGILAVAW